MNMQSPKPGRDRPDGFYWLDTPTGSTIGLWTTSGVWEQIGSADTLDDAELVELGIRVGPPIGDPVEPGDIMVDRLNAAMEATPGRFTRADVERAIRLLDVPGFWGAAVAGMGLRLASMPEAGKSTAKRDADGMQALAFAAPVLFRLLEGAVK
jgi:hypothetical protein